MNAVKGEANGVQLDLPLEAPRGTLASHARIWLGGRLVEYTVRRSPRRGSITLTIDERGIRVGAPWRTGERAIENQLRRHEAWVLRKLAEWQQRRAPPRRWEDGETLMLMGEPLRLTLAPGFHAIDRNDDRLIVGTSAGPRPEQIAAGVTAWLREQALACFRERITHYAPLLAATVLQVRLSSARTRWGSCHAAGRILLNWRLVQMPLQLVDYVVVHELAHLKEMNHSPRFWRIVGHIIPDYAARRRAIRVDAYRYVLA